MQIKMTNYTVTIISVIIKSQTHNNFIKFNKNIFSPIKVLSTTSYYLTDGGHYTEFLGSYYVLFWHILLFPEMLPRLWISLKNFYFRFCISYAIQTPTRCNGFVFWLLPLVIRHILEGPVKSLIRMDFMQFSTVVALDNTFSISNPTLELWELSNSA